MHEVEDLPDARAEEGEIVGREIGDRSERQQTCRATPSPASAGVARKAAGMMKRRLAVLGEPDARRRHQMIGHLAPVERRNAPHGVDDVLVEAGEEPESVLAGQAVLDRATTPVSATCARCVPVAVVDHRNAAGLAARDVAPFEHHDLEAALDQFVRGAHARHAAAQNDDSVGMGHRRIGE